VESSLSAAIVSGELSPGTLVSAPTLAAQFQVSATPVREAMLNLAKRGFVQPVRNKGFRVTSVSKKDLEELVQVRRWLEAPAMRIVATKLTGQSADEFRLLADQITGAAARSDFHDYLTADAHFHLDLLKLTGNDRLVELVSELRKQTRLVGLATLSNTVELENSAHEHHELLDLLVAGRGADAEKLAYKHIGHVIGWWAGLPEGRPTTT
jgi:DNA-binding GntR family transcriptional regulator